MENQISPITVSGGRPTHFQAFFSIFFSYNTDTIYFQYMIGNLSDNQ